MQVSPNELIKIMAETANRTALEYIEKMKKEVKPKQRIIEIEVIYDKFDYITGNTTYCYNYVMCNKPTNACQLVMDKLAIRLVAEDKEMRYNPVNMTYEVFGKSKDGNDIVLYKLCNIHERIVGHIEI